MLPELVVDKDKFDGKVDDHQKFQKMDNLPELLEVLGEKLPSFKPFVVGLAPNLLNKLLPPKAAANQPPSKKDLLPPSIVDLPPTQVPQLVHLGLMQDIGNIGKAWQVHM